MTIPYGGTAYGLGEQQLSDARKHGIAVLNFLENRWGAYMGRMVFDTCKSALKRPMQLLAIFEEAGKLAEEESRFLQWTVPATNFPVMQYYIEGVVKKVWIQYGPPLGQIQSTGYFENTYQVNISIIEETKPSKRKQSQGASPNIIHSLDAAHLMLTIEACDFPITTIHDSFGCLLADMPDLYVKVRETFVQMYSENPIHQIFECIHADISRVDFGVLDIQQIIESEYCFA